MDLIALAESVVEVYAKLRYKVDVRDVTVYVHGTKFVATVEDRHVPAIKGWIDNTVARPLDEYRWSGMLS